MLSEETIQPTQPTKRGRGRPPKPAVQHVRDGTYSPSRHGERLCRELGVATLVEAYAFLGLDRRPPTRRLNLDAVGPSPRRRLVTGLATGEGFGDPAVSTDGPWLATLYESVEGEPLPPAVRALLDEALAFDDEGCYLHAC